MSKSTTVNKNWFTPFTNSTTVHKNGFTLHPLAIINVKVTLHPLAIINVKVYYSNENGVIESKQFI